MDGSISIRTFTHEMKGEDETIGSKEKRSADKKNVQSDDLELTRYQRVKFMILKTKFSNEIAYQYYKNRQFYIGHLPLQLMAMVVTISGYLGGGVDVKAGKDDLDILSIINGIMGSIIVFFTSLSKTLDYDAKAKQHQLIASQMKLLLDDMEVYEHKYKYSLEGEKTQANNNETEKELQGRDDKYPTSRGIEEIESRLFYSTQGERIVLPSKIGLAFSKLEFQLKLKIRIHLMAKSQDPLILDSLAEYAYAELAAMLSGRIFRLPSPEKSAGIALERAEAVCIGTYDDILSLPSQQP